MKHRNPGDVLTLMVNGSVSMAILAGVVFATGCRGNGDSDPVPASLPGTYAYDAKGTVFKKQWQFSTRLDLTPDRHFTLTLDKTIDGKTDPTETSTGAYAVDGDQILLREIRPALGVSEDVHKLRVKADSLIAEVGWTGELFLKGVGAPNVVFVKQSGS
ncbi:MAG TPA: hypothetical protein VK571_08770 [Gemmatimonadaceae bacterium]|nr:hypothetical protein [Gemmatimonadaceae bacterium]